MEITWRGLLAAALTATFMVPAGAAERGAATAAADPASTVPALSYVSPFADYRRFDEGTRMPWRDANDAVGALRGHIGQMRDGDDPIAGSSPPRHR